jgi:hypothetical protein
MFDNFGDLIDANSRAIDALNQCLTRLNDLAVGAFPAQFALLQAQINRVTSETNLLNVINAHLVAATTTFQPLDPSLKADLADNFSRIDHAITSGTIATAAVDTINDIFASATKIANATHSATQD